MYITLHTNNLHKHINVYGLTGHPDIHAFIPDVNGSEPEDVWSYFKKNSVLMPNGKHLCFIKIDDEESELVSYDTDTDDLASLAGIANEFLTHPLKYI